MASMGLYRIKSSNPYDLTIFGPQGLPQDVRIHLHEVRFIPMDAALIELQVDVSVVLHSSQDQSAQRGHQFVLVPDSFFLPVDNDRNCLLNGVGPLPLETAFLPRQGQTALVPHALECV